MKCKNSHFGLLAALFIAAFLISSCTPSPVDVTTEIEEANKAIMDIRKSGDAEALSMFYTIDAKLFPANGELVVGREAIKAFIGEDLTAASPEIIFETISAEGYGDMAIEEGRYKVLVGSHEVGKGKYIVKWKKEDGKWKLHRDIWNSDLPVVQSRASVGQTVWVISNRIKADKVSQFEDFNLSVLGPAAAEISPEEKNTVRSLRPVEPNKDGTYTYFYLMDPAISPDGYDMAETLTTKYGKEKSDEYLKMFRECLVGDQEMVVTVQTKW